MSENSTPISGSYGVRSVLTQNIIFLLSTTGFIYTLYFWHAEQPMLTIPGLIISVSLISALYPLSKGWNLFTKFWVIFWTNSAIYYNAIAIGHEAGIQNFFFAVSVLPFILFSSEEKKYVLPAILISVLGYLFSQTYFLSSILPHVSLPHSNVRTIYFLTAGMTFVIVNSSFYIYSANIAKLTKKLLNVIKKLDSTNCELDQQNDALKKAGKTIKETQLTIESLRHHATLGTLIRGIAHEVKNPIASIQASCAIILKSHTIEERTREKLEVILHHIKQLGDLTKTLLKDSGIITSADTELKIGEIIDQVLRLVENEAYIKKITLPKDIQKNLPMIKGNTAFITQALLNLYINAIQHTPENGEIHTKIEATQNTVEITISDTGPGIRKEIQDHLFDENITTGSNDNLNVGLGLFFVKKVVEAHQGSIRINTSSTTEGASFTLIFPNAKTQ